MAKKTDSIKDKERFQRMLDKLKQIVALTRDGNVPPQQLGLSQNKIFLENNS